MDHFLIIGGSNAGISAATRIKQLDAKADVSVVIADAYAEFSICGLPFFLSGFGKKWFAPTFRAISRSFSWPLADIIRTGIEAVSLSSRNRVHTSNPSKPGSMMSSITISGFSSRAFLSP